MSIVKTKTHSWQETVEEGKRLLEEHPELKSAVDAVIKAVQKWERNYDDSDFSKADDELCEDCARIIESNKFDESDWRLVKKIAKHLDSTIAYGVTLPTFNDLGM